MESFDAGDKCWEALVVFLACAKEVVLELGNELSFVVDKTMVFGIPRQ